MSKVSDGDTFTAYILGEQKRIRLSHIDCPELKQNYGQQARVFVSNLIKGKSVKIRINGTDRYKRILATVYLSDGKCLNELLVEKGFAWHYIQYSDDPVLEKLEQQARKKRKGLWSETNPKAPWEFRKEKRSIGSNN